MSGLTKSTTVENSTKRTGKVILQRGEGSNYFGLTGHKIDSLGNPNNRFQIPIDIMTGRPKQIISIEDFYALDIKPELRDAPLKERYDEYNKFFNEYVFVISNTRTVFNLENDYQYLEYLIVKAIAETSQSRIAPSKNVYSPAMHSYYLMDVEQEAKQTLVNSQVKVKAYGLLNTITIEEQIDLALLLGLIDLKEDYSPAVVMSRLVNYVDVNPANALTVWEDKLKTQKVLFKKLVTYNILRKQNDGYFYNEIHLGVQEKEVIKFLHDSKNQQIVTSLLSQLKDK